MKPEKTGRRCVLILLILLAAVFFLSFLLGRYRVSALQTARLLADRALSGVSQDSAIPNQNPALSLDRNMRGVVRYEKQRFCLE